MHHNISGQMARTSSMRPLHSFFARLICLGMLVTTLGPAAQAQETVEPAGPTIEIGESVTSDAEIRSRIQKIFREIDGLTSLGVSVSSGVVTLSG